MALKKIAIWDLPVRLAHWGFAVLIPAMWWTAENGEMGWHMRLGFVLFALVLFRIFWGFFGSTTARFASFISSPKAAIIDLFGRGKQFSTQIGHSPSAAWSVIAMLAMILAQVSMGLFAGDPFDGATGPLNSLVGVATADWLTDWHETGFWVIVGLVTLHLAAIFYYQIFARRNLIPPMITGSGTVFGATKGNTAGSIKAMAICALVAGGIATAIGSGIIEQFFAKAV